MLIYLFIFSAEKFLDCLYPISEPDLWLFIGATHSNIFFCVFFLSFFWPYGKLSRSGSVNHMEVSHDPDFNDYLPVGDRCFRIMVHGSRETTTTTKKKSDLLNSTGCKRWERTSQTSSSSSKKPKADALKTKSYKDKPAVSSGPP